MPTSNDERSLKKQVQISGEISPYSGGNVTTVQGDYSFSLHPRSPRTTLVPPVPSDPFVASSVLPRIFLGPFLHF